MTRILMIAIAAATLGTVAVATDATTSNDTLMTRSVPATVTLFERDRGISDAGFVAGTSGTEITVDADRILAPRDQAIADDGQVSAYSFQSTNDVNSVVSSPR